MASKLYVGITSEIDGLLTGYYCTTVVHLKLLSSKVVEVLLGLHSKASKMPDVATYSASLCAAFAEKQPDLSDVIFIPK